MKRTVAALLFAALLLGIFAGCKIIPAPGRDGKSRPISGSSIDLSSNIQADPVDADSTALKGDTAIASADFAVRLFQASIKPGENTLVSPVSVLYALAMTANGAKGDTLAQMEKVLGASVPELNVYLRAYMDSLSESEKYKLNIANAIWFTDKQSFTADPEFLQKNADNYGAGIYQAPFDETTLDDINKWVEYKTDGMIKDILDRIPESAVMYLVNALAFDAEWEEIYKENKIRDSIFTTEDGEEQEAELMYSEERRFLEDENAVGFIKYYADQKYAFAALLPDEGITVADYAASLTGEKLHGLLSDPEIVKVRAAIPKFESEYSTEMSSILADMGMPDAFDVERADFSGLAESTEGNIFINRVLHKTFIAVDERGTKAGAATVVEMIAESCAPGYEEIREVILNRPFVYMLIDCESNLPLFIGTVTDMA